MPTFDIVGSLDRIKATCDYKKVHLIDSHIIYPNGKIKLTLDKKTTFTLIEGDELYASKLIRDIALIALDQPYYTVTMEEWDELKNA
jgi:hypothetical protein